MISSLLQLFLIFHYLNLHTSFYYFLASLSFFVEQKFFFSKHHHQPHHWSPSKLSLSTYKITSQRICDLNSSDIYNKVYVDLSRCTRFRSFCELLTRAERVMNHQQCFAYIEGIKRAEENINLCYNCYCSFAPTLNVYFHTRLLYTLSMSVHTLVWLIRIRSTYYPSIKFKRFFILKVNDLPHYISSNQFLELSRRCYTNNFSRTFI